RTEFWLSTSVAFEKILEFGELFEESELDRTDRSVPLLRDNEVRLAGVLFILLVDFFTVDEHDEISILFDGSRFAQVRQLRAVIALALLRCAAQLRKGNNRQFEFLSQRL